MDTPTIDNKPATNPESLAGDTASAVAQTPPSPMQAPAGGAPDASRQAQTAQGGNDTTAAADAQQGASDSQGEALPPSPMQAPGEPAEPTPDVVPEQYEPFSVPDGYDLDPTAIQNCGEQFREMGLSQAKAQKMVDLHYRMIQRQEALYQKQIEDSARQWYNEIHSRPDFAGEQALVNKGIQAVIKTPEQKELFKNPTFSYSPLIWDIFREVGKLVSEDTIGGTRTQSAPPVDDNPYHINL